MTLEEKAAQLGSVNADRVVEGGEVDREAASKWLEYGIGHLTRIGGEGSLSPTDAARVTNELQEILGEDPLLVAAMACGYVSGLQGEGGMDGVSATLKHFAGHGATDGGKNRSSLNVGPVSFGRSTCFPTRICPSLETHEYRQSH